MSMPKSTSRHRTHHNAFPDPSFANLREIRRLIGRNPMIAVDTAGEAVVVRPINRRQTSGAPTVESHTAGEIEALEIPSLLRGRCSCLVVAESLAFGGIAGLMGSTC